MVHLNMDEVEHYFKQLKADTYQYMQDLSDDILKEIHQKVNAELNKFSRLQVCGSATHTLRENTYQENQAILIRLAPIGLKKGGFSKGFPFIFR